MFAEEQAVPLEPFNVALRDGLPALLGERLDLLADIEAVLL